MSTPVEAGAQGAPWFRDLANGSGAAKAMPERLRRALCVVTSDAAREHVARARAEAERRAAAERALADRKRAEAARAAQERERELAATRARAANERVARRRSIDRRLMVGAVLASVTVLVPWLVGRFILRDGPLHPRAGGVYDEAARDTGAYFGADWLGGVGVLVLLAAAAVLLGSWRRRASTVVPALVLGGFAIAVVLPASGDHWADAEAETVTRLATTPFPFGDHWATCGGETFEVPDGTRTRTLQVYTARTSGASGCDRLVTYDGWREIATVTLPSGETLSMAGGSFSAFESWEVTRFEGTSPADTGVLTVTTTGDLIGLVLATPDQIWRAPTAGAELEYHPAGLVLASYGVGQLGARVEAIDPLTGGVRWTVGCPAADQALGSAAKESDTGMVYLRCNGPGGVGDTGARDYTVGLDGVLQG